VKYTEEYFQISETLNHMYLNQLAIIFERPSIVCAISTTLKTQSELLENKILALQIIKNLCNGPNQVIESLNTCAIDNFMTIARFMIISKKGGKYK
jgi:hypothetical protein